MKRLFIAITIATVAAAPAFADPSIDTTHAATANAAVHIDNIAGKVKIIGWDKNRVHVTGHLGSADQQLKVTGDKDDIDIQVRYPQCHYSNDHSHDCHGNIDEGASIRVQLPRAATINADTVSASIDARQVTARQHLESVSGTIALQSKSPEIEIQSVSGDATIKGSAPDARIEVHGVSGDIRVLDVDGELRAKSISGKVSVMDSQLARARLTSISGDLQYSGSIEKEGVYTLHSTSGKISLNLPAKPDATFNLTTLSGDIDNAIGPKSERAHRFGPGQKLHFASRNGSARVNAKTLSGNIVLQVDD